MASGSGPTELIHESAKNQTAALIAANPLLQTAYAHYSAIRVIHVMQNKDRAPEAELPHG